MTIRIIWDCNAVGIFLRSFTYTSYSAKLKIKPVNLLHISIFSQQCLDRGKNPHSGYFEWRGIRIEAIIVVLMGLEKRVWFLSLCWSPRSHPLGSFCCGGPQSCWGNTFLLIWNLGMDIFLLKFF